MGCIKYTNLVDGPIFIMQTHFLLTCRLCSFLEFKLYKFEMKGTNEFNLVVAMFVQVNFNEIYASFCSTHAICIKLNEPGVYKIVFTPDFENKVKNV